MTAASEQVSKLLFETPYSITAELFLKDFMHFKTLKESEKNVLLSLIYVNTIVCKESLLKYSLSVYLSYSFSGCLI